MLPTDAASRSYRGSEAGDVTPVIILTRNGFRSATGIEGLNAGADDYMVKPSILSELSARVGCGGAALSGNPNPWLTLGGSGVEISRAVCVSQWQIGCVTAREWVFVRGLRAKDAGAAFVKGAVWKSAVFLRYRGREATRLSACQQVA